MASASDGPHSMPHMPDFSAHNSPFSSAGDMKFHLQNLLDSKEKQLQQAGTLGQRVLAQQMELEERIRQLQELEADKSEEDDIDAEARERYRELADTIIAWDSENAQLSNAFGGSKRFANGKAPSPQISFAELPREEPDRSKASASNSAAQSRRAKNAAHRADDVEFAFEIGSGLLTEVRRLQSLLGERDKAIQDMKEEKDDLEKSVESLRTALRQQEQSADKFKEENWNLEVTLQDLPSAQRLELLAASRDAGDQHKNESERLQTIIEEMKNKHETDVAQARKHAAGLARDKSDLQQTIETLKTEASRAGRRLPRFGSPLTPNGPGTNDYLTPAGDHGDDDVFTGTGGASTNRRRLDTSAMFPPEDLGSDFADSPEPSPVRSSFLAPNHPSNEIEALQQRLAHAQRQINTLKGTLQREKQLRMDYKSRLEGVSPSGAAAFEEADLEDEEGDAIDGKPAGRRATTPFKVGGRGGRTRGRGRGRGNMTLIQRLGMAANSPSSEYNDDQDPRDLDDSPPPPVPPIPIRFSQVEDDEGQGIFGSSTITDLRLEDLDVDTDQQGAPGSPSPSSLEPPSNRTSVDGMDPAFANVLKRVPSNGSYTGSPLRQSVLDRSTRRGTVGRRQRGGVPYKEARPPSLVGAPDVLSAELFNGGSPVQDLDILIPEEDHKVETAEFGCQTEVEEMPPPEVVIPIVTVETGIQSDPEPIPEPAPAVITRDSTMQTDAPILVEKAEISSQTEEPPKAPVIARSEMAIQHEEVVAPQPARVSSSMGTDPEVLPIRAQVEIQTRVVEMADADTQTPPSPVFVPASSTSELSRRSTITQSDMANSSFGSSSGNTTITRGTARPFLAEFEDDASEDEDEDDGDETETGTETETDADNYHDAHQSIGMSTPSDDDDDDDASVRASQLVNGSMASSVGGPQRPSSYYANIPPPVLSYESVGVSAELLEEPAPPIIPEPVIIAPPKPEVKEISIQTDEWKPPPSSTTPGFGLYHVGSKTQEFKFIAPPAAPTPNIPTIVPFRPPFPPPHRESSESQASRLVGRAIPCQTGGSPLICNIILELIQRATTPTFGAVLSVPGGKGSFPLRQHARLRQLPSTSSFRSAANAATYAQHSTPNHSALGSFSVREREQREFSTTSLASERSVASPRSSISSGHHYNHSQDPATPNKTADITPRAIPANSTDPAIIHAITQTMIGEFLYKYTRRAIGKGYGERRHKRFFWVHPYTKTLYWSSADPGSSNVSESSAKSAYIEGVRSVLDPNPMPPGLYQYSVVVSTPQREMKITAPTKERHDIWLNVSPFHLAALKYLLSRPNGMNITSPANNTAVPPSPVSGEYTDDDRRPPLTTSPQSQRSGRSARQGDTWNTTPRGQRSRSQLSARGSIGKRSGTPAVEYLRWNGPDSPYSPSKSFVDVPAHDDEDLDFELHGDSLSDDAFEGMENVRACCDGRHTVGHSGKHHHHHHHDHPTISIIVIILFLPIITNNTWSLLRRAHTTFIPICMVLPVTAGSTNSHDGGDGKLRFGSRRSTKTIPHNQ
ncbi:hypothetical protein BD779DRAFT_1662013 [Infundibulicybe gibba]|nr:hypothetical protein BD779DRAFT_1662013 [Infundibulicybe gibba]